MATYGCSQRPHTQAKNAPGSTKVDDTVYILTANDKCMYVNLRMRKRHQRTTTPRLLALAVEKVRTTIYRNCWQMAPAVGKVRTTIPKLLALAVGASRLVRHKRSARWYTFVTVPNLLPEHCRIRSLESMYETCTRTPSGWKISAGMAR